MSHFSNRFTLKDYLEKLPADTVLTRFSKGENDKRKILSSKILSEMIEQTTSFSSVKDRYDALSLDLKQLILQTYLCGSGGYKVAITKNEKEELLNSFLVYLMVDDDLSEYLYGFSDLDDIFNKYFIEEFQKFYEKDFQKQSLPFFKYRAINDLVAVLNLSGRNELKLKKNGELTLASISELKKITHISTDTIHFLKKTKATEFIYKFLIHFSFEQGLVYKKDNLLLISANKASDWFTRDASEIYDDLIRTAVDYCGRWNINLLKDFISNGKLYSLSSQREILIDEALQLFHYCGIIGALIENKEHLICETGELWEFEKENSTGSVIILPDFSVMISQTVSPELLYEFSKIGRLAKLDKVYKGKIEKDALFDSLSSGLNGEHVIKFLENWRAPSNIIISVKEWISEFHRVSVESGKFIFVSDSETVSNIGSHPYLSEFIEEVKTASVFRIKSGYEQRVISTLDSFGFDIRNQNMSNDVEPEPTALLPESDRKIKKLKLVSDFISQATEESEPEFSGGGKYSSTLKELSHHDMIQVIDYALLMDSDLVIDYKGSDGVKKGMYTGEPLKITGPNGSLLEITESDSGNKVTLLVEQIFRIAVTD